MLFLCLSVFSCFAVDISGFCYFLVLCFFPCIVPVSVWGAIVQICVDPPCHVIIAWVAPLAGCLRYTIMSCQSPVLGANVHPSIMGGYDSKLKGYIVLAGDRGGVVGNLPPP